MSHGNMRRFPVAAHNCKSGWRVKSSGRDPAKNGRELRYFCRTYRMIQKVGTRFSEKIMRLKSFKHSFCDIHGAVPAAEFHRLDAAGIGLIDRALDAFSRL